MAVWVRVHDNPQIERSVVTTEKHALGDAIRVRFGALEVIDRKEVIKAYGAGYWIDAEVMK